MTIILARHRTAVIPYLFGDISVKKMVVKG